MLLTCIVFGSARACVSHYSVIAHARACVTDSLLQLCGACAQGLVHVCTPRTLVHTETLLNTLHAQDISQD